jgi:hypothetical protein
MCVHMYVKLHTHLLKKAAYKGSKSNEGIKCVVSYKLNTECSEPSILYTLYIYIYDMDSTKTLKEVANENTSRLKTNKDIRHDHIQH